MHKYNIGEYLYNILPPIYRKADLDTDETLRRYLDALGISVGNVLDDTVNLLELIDVEKIPTRLLPYYGRMFGFEYDDSVPEDFQRKYLANIVDIFKRKGTKAVIRFTARELTGMDATVTEGHYLGFKTWGTNPHDEKCGEYVQPRTYGGKTKTPFYYLGGDNTSRYTIIVSLSADEGKDSNEIFLNTQLISRYTKELVQPYVNLRYRAYGMSYNDERVVSNILEGDSLKVLDTNKVIPNIVETEVQSRIVNKEDLTYSNNLVSKSLDRLKLLRLEIDENTNEVEEVGQDYTKIVHKINDTITVVVNKEWNDIILDIPTPDTLKVRVKDTEKMSFKDSDNKDIDLDNILPYQDADYIHTTILNDIMTLGDRIETSFEDTITEIDKGGN